MYKLYTVNLLCRSRHESFPIITHYIFRSRDATGWLGNVIHCFKDKAFEFVASDQEIGCFSYS